MLAITQDSVNWSRVRQDYYSQDSLLMSKSLYCSTLLELKVGVDQAVSLLWMSSTHWWTIGKRETQCHYIGFVEPDHLVRVPKSLDFPINMFATAQITPPCSSRSTYYYFRSGRLHRQASCETKTSWLLTIPSSHGPRTGVQSHSVWQSLKHSRDFCHGTSWS